MVRTSYHGQCTCTAPPVQTQIQIAISRPGHRDAGRPIFTNSRLLPNPLRWDIHRDSIYELSVNTTSGAPSFVRSLRKGWETTDFHRNCKHTGRRRSKALYSSPSAPANPSQEPRAPSLRIVSAAKVGNHSPQPAKPIPSLILFQVHAQKLLDPLQVCRIESRIGPESML